MGGSFRPHQHRVPDVLDLSELPQYEFDPVELSDNASARVLGIGAPTGARSSLSRCHTDSG